MKHFRDQNNKIYAFEADGSQDHLITDDMVEITEAERDAIIEQNKPAPTWDDIRNKRDLLIKEVEWRFTRHASEKRQGLTPTDDIVALDAYVQKLRDIPQDFNAPDGDPEYVIYPDKP